MNKRMIVCNKCGLLYDLHYIDNRTKDKFECIKCGMVEITTKNMETFE